MQKNDYALEYKSGKELVLPDMLSWVPVSQTVDDNTEEEILLHVHLVSRTLPVTESKLEEIKRETADDQSMRTLSETIKCVWPETKVQTPVSIHAYWDVRDELSELNGVVLRGERIVIPPSMRKEMLERIHQGLMGIEKSKRRPRDTLFWLGMNSHITDTVSRCTICLEHRKQNAKEPMIPSRVSSKPWELVAT